MKQSMMKGIAIAFFAATMSMSGNVQAAPNIACTASLAGKTVYIQSGGWRHYYICRPPTWIYLRSCPVGGGSCVS